MDIRTKFDYNSIVYYLHEKSIGQIVVNSARVAGIKIYVENNETSIYYNIEEINSVHDIFNGVEIHEDFLFNDAKNLKIEFIANVRTMIQNIDNSNNQKLISNNDDSDDLPF